MITQVEAFLIAGSILTILLNLWCAIANIRSGQTMKVKMARATKALQEPVRIVWLSDNEIQKRYKLHRGEMLRIHFAEDPSEFFISRDHGIPDDEDDEIFISVETGPEIAQ